MGRTSDANAAAIACACKINRRTQCCPRGYGIPACPAAAAAVVSVFCFTKRAVKNNRITRIVNRQYGSTKSGNSETVRRHLMHKYRRTWITPSHPTSATVRL